MIKLKDGNILKANLWLVLVLVFTSCAREQKVNTLFETIDPSFSGIKFSNDIIETDSLNYFTYPYMYMGGGVAIGDFNNDGLNDLFFTANMQSNRLYMNKGQLKFEDITRSSGIISQNKWHTGVTTVDINNDGWLDIYVSVSGKSKNRQNLLYINNGDLTFTESAKDYGIADNGHSTQGTFFDYDGDGDLDLYVANYPPAPFGSSVFYYEKRMSNLNEEDSDKLFENQGDGKFVDVTIEAGVLNYGLSLSATIGDLNNDGWSDIYVSNDFSTPDYLYVNNQDGTFSEASKNSLRHTSQFGMGVDIADFNNDGLLDIIQMDMTPEDNRRSKANMASMNPKMFWERVNSGMHFQYMQNCLQLNQGVDNHGNLSFGDISRLAGIATTDWSWASLMADLDNDGWKDIFITNGTRRDVSNRDFFLDLGHKKRFNENIEVDPSQIPSEKIENYAFRNNGDLSFGNSSKPWGLNFKGFSNGAAYADLDNDGDLDMVVNNLDTVSLVFKNLGQEQGLNNYLRIKLKGPENNLDGFGTKVTILVDSLVQTQELTVSRGFQSSVESILHFGLGEIDFVNKLTVLWPDGKSQTFDGLSANRVYSINYTSAKKISADEINVTDTKLFSRENDLLETDFVHKENDFDDYYEQPLLPYQPSRLGPGLEIGDVNGDGLDDFYIGGAHGFAGGMFLQDESGHYKVTSEELWIKESKYEDLDAKLFDADSDGDLDLYVVSGGNKYEHGTRYLEDRLYINNGLGQFDRNEQALPRKNVSGSCVVSIDFDNDGDLDLFIGGRLIPGNYPKPSDSYILINDDGVFKDASSQMAPFLKGCGMVTSAVGTDFDNDGLTDLVVVGEWMPISFYKNEGDHLEDVTDLLNMGDTKGWWYSISMADFDNDGDDDFIVGNLGLNYKYQASMKEPFEVYSDDFDRNGSLDIVLSYYNDGSLFPVRGLQCSSEQMPSIKSKFNTYNSFASASVFDVYGERELSSAKYHYQAYSFATSYIENVGGNQFRIKNLDNMAQLSSVNSIITEDFNEDGHIDVLLAGNLYSSEIETPRNDASCGLVLMGDGKGDFRPISPSKSGLYLSKDVKNIALINSNQRPLILVANNQDKLEFIRVNKRRFKKLKID